MLAKGEFFELRGDGIAGQISPNDPEYQRARSYIKVYMHTSRAFGVQADCGMDEARR